jgi:peptide/nickel transport system substrate-binding protein
MSSTPLSRRAAVRLFGSATAMALMAACSAPASPSAPVAPTTPPAAQPTPAATPAAAATSAPASVAATGVPTPATASAAAQPKSGGTLRQGYVGDLIGLDGHNRSGNDGIWFVYDRLTAYDDQHTPTPMLAESWDISPDARQYTFHLRHGVMFHNGRELNSADVKYNIQRTADPKNGGGQLAPLASWWTAIDTPDKYTVVVTSDLSRPNAFDYFEYLNIINQETQEGPDSKTTGVGTGPWKFVEWVQGDHVTLGKNTNYWQSGKPYLDGITIPILRDQQAMVAELEAGTLDVARGPSLRDYARLKDDPNFSGLAHTATGGFYVIGANTSRAPTDNKLVRQALNFAFDRQRFVDTVLLGVGKAESIPWQPTSPAYEADKVNTYTFDLDKAKSLLDQAGVGPFDIDILLYLSTAEYQGMAQLYQADLAKLGITLNIKTQDVGTWLDQVNNAKYLGLYSGPASLGDLAPATCFTSSKAFAPASNNSAFKSDRYSELITQTATEPDPAKAKPLYSELNDLFLDESFTMVLSPTLPTLLNKKGVHGVTYTHHEMVTYTDAWLDS